VSLLVLHFLTFPVLSFRRLQVSLRHDVIDVALTGQSQFLGISDLLKLIFPHFASLFFGFFPLNFGVVLFKLPLSRIFILKPLLLIMIAP
jgi:hypothetical protein